MADSSTKQAGSEATDGRKASHHTSHGELGKIQSDPSKSVLGIKLDTERQEGTLYRRSSEGEAREKTTEESKECVIMEFWTEGSSHGDGQEDQPGEKFNRTGPAGKRR